MMINQQKCGGALEQMDSRGKKHYIYWMFAIFGAVTMSILLFFIIYRYSEFSDSIAKLMGIASPLIYGAAIAYLLKPICNFYERKLRELLSEKHKKLANMLAVAGSMLTAFIIIYLLLMIIIPQVGNSVSRLVQTVPEKLNQASVWMEDNLDKDFGLPHYLTEVYGEIKTALNKWIEDVLSPNIQNILEGVGEQIWNSVMFLKNFLIGIFVAIYLLASRKKFGEQAKLILYSIFKTKWADIILSELKYADSMFVGFINGKILDSAIIGVICYVCCLIFKFPNAMLVSVIVGVTNIIPFFGPFIGAVPATLLIFIDSPIKAVWFIVFVIALQQADGNVIGPKILGNSTGLSSFWVLFSILIFGGLWGFVGMIIGVPLFAVIYDITKKLVFYGLRKNGCDEMIEKRNEEET